jgi:hypothetical protein
MNAQSIVELSVVVLVAVLLFLLNRRARQSEGAGG